MTENNLNTDHGLTINATWNTMLYNESDKMSRAPIHSKMLPPSLTRSTVSADLTGPIPGYHLASQSMIGVSCAQHLYKGDTSMTATIDTRFN